MATYNTTSAHYIRNDEYIVTAIHINNHRSSVYIDIYDTDPTTLDDIRCALKNFDFLECSDIERYINGNNAEIMIDGKYFFINYHKRGAK